MAKVVSVVALTLWAVLCTVRADNSECRGGRKNLMMPTTDCCNVNITPEQSECLQKIREKWMEKRKSQDKENVDMSDVGCGSDCLFKSEFVTSDNQIIVDEVKKGLEQFLGSEWQSLMPDMIETCKSRPAPHGGHKGEHKGHKGHKCNPVKEMFLFCIHEQILEKCPDSLWKNEEKCNNAREYLKKCPFEKRVGKRGKPGQEGQEGQAEEK